VSPQPVDLLVGALLVTVIAVAVDPNLAQQTANVIAVIALAVVVIGVAVWREIQRLLIERVATGLQPRRARAWRPS
jgi:hypothetical protein